MRNFTLFDFVRESNWIEGMTDVLDYEIRAHEEFLALSRITIPDLEKFVAAVQPWARLRDKVGLDVRVGDHVPIPGGSYIPVYLKDILKDANSTTGDAYGCHLAYEDLHPFTDGNGRSGRVLWLWQMGGKSPLGFLHEFYYQALRYAG